MRSCKQLLRGARRSRRLRALRESPASNVKSYVDKLASLGIVERELPLNETSNKRAVYLLSDQMFRFWYKFVPQNIGLIQNDMAEMAYKRIEPHVSDYMGTVFELICRQYVYELARAGELGVVPATVGRWWGTDNRTRTQEEIDLIVDDGEGAALFAECKWRNEPARRGCSGKARVPKRAL